MRDSRQSLYLKYTERSVGTDFSTDINMADIFETAIVEKRNVLNELRTTLHSTQELRLFSIYLSKINPYDTNTRGVRFLLSDFQRIMNFGKLNIAQLKASASSILDKKVFIPKESGGFRGINLFEVFEMAKRTVWGVKGDANSDGSVDMSDVVLIMQALASPNKYGLNGSNNNHINENGLKCSDVDSTPGLTVNDALHIQKYLLRIIPTL